MSREGVVSPLFLPSYCAVTRESLAFLFQVNWKDKDLNYLQQVCPPTCCNIFPMHLLQQRTRSPAVTCNPVTRCMVLLS